MTRLSHSNATPHAVNSDFDRKYSLLHPLNDRQIPFINVNIHRSILTFKQTIQASMTAY